ncbi:LacI family DNA-binding transcriptional regulator [Bifidobacterium oedipodis]|uniref:LacI family transcriptional regulator n=1 Tax=Bifidobacterium oedipodis TaxID=2675322 RepID=A0A7Y0EQF9_9BIFI|nr:LacI family DNA-binding transcriptional regulator [Bifidobacterium sp. DSM 109957]NMM94568.1 LacI family transcriptional regulator [Bifidobacterium sp. DSM 109957]
MVTLKDVATLAGVSPTTASAALRGLDVVKPETTAKVRQAASDLNYRVNASAKMLRSGQTGIFTLAVPELTTPFYATLADCMSEEVESHGYRLIIRKTRFSAQTERRVLSELSTTFSDGIFIIVTQLSIQQVKDLLGQRPAVLFEDFSMDGLFDSVNTPGADGIITAISHLKDCGRTAIGVIGGLPDSELALQPGAGLTARARLDRLNAAKRALRAMELDDHAGFMQADWSVDGGVAAAHKLVEQGLPYDGLCCMNDDLALGLLRGFHECGVAVPDQVAVIGFDGIPQGSWSVPTLSTIAVDFDGAARSALQLMLRHCNNPDAPAFCQRVTIGHRLIPRESTVGAYRQ